MTATAMSEEVRDFDPLENADLLVEVVRALVMNPEDVKVDEEEKAEGTYLTIRVAPEDRGRLIGRQGATICLIMELFKRIAASDGDRVFVRLEERPVPSRRMSSRRPPRQPPPARSHRR